MRRAPRTPKRQAGFWNFVIPAVASIIGAGVGRKGQDDANDANIEMQRETNQFNADQAALGRDWGHNEAILAREFNSAEAAKNRDFQAGMFQSAQDYNTTMANTAYQRAVGDMRAAGLNPMLAYSQGGAPAPTMSAPSGSAASGPQANGATASTANSVRLQSSAIAGLNSAAASLQLSNLAKQGENIDADTKVKEATAHRESNSAVQIAAETEATVTGRIPKLREEIKNIQADTVNKDAQGTLIDVQTRLAKVQTMVATGQLDKQEAETALLKVERILKEYQQAEAKAYSDKFSGNYGSTVTPYMREILDVLRLLVFSSRGR